MMSTSTSTIFLGGVSLIGTRGTVWHSSPCLVVSRRSSPYPFHGTVPTFLNRHFLTTVLPGSTSVQSSSVTSAMNSAASPLCAAGAAGGLVERIGQSAGVDTAGIGPADG